MIPEFSERCVILAPAGRDAQVAAEMLREAGIRGFPCSGLEAVVAELEAGEADVVVGLRPEAAVALDSARFVLLHRPTL